MPRRRAPRRGRCRRRSTSRRSRAWSAKRSRKSAPPARGAVDGTVSQPLELKKYGVPDMTFSEAIGSMLSDDPKAIMRAVSRKHPAMWRRCILLGRATGKSPMQALYAALEAGLEQLEQTQLEVRDVA
jgi:hypothetical protein